MTQHEQYIDKAYFDAVNNGVMTFIVRKDDRDYRIGDTIRLVCTDDGNVVTVPNYRENKEVELRCMVAVTYLFYHEDYPNAISDGYLVIGVRKL